MWKSIRRICLGCWVNQNNSFLDYEYGYIDKVGEKDYEFKLRNFGINKGIDYNKESDTITIKNKERYSLKLV